MKTHAHPTTRALVHVSDAESRLQATRTSIEAAEAVLTARFHQARREGLRTLVQVSVECGQILLEARVALRGRYRAWVKENLRLERSTAENYVAIAKLARSAPAQLERHKDLGVSKLYQVARLEPAARDQVLANPQVPGMNDREFKRVVTPLRSRAGTHKVTGAMRAHGMTERVKSFSKKLTDWRPGRIGESEARKELLRELRALRQAVDQVVKRLS